MRVYLPRYMIRLSAKILHFLICQYRLATMLTANFSADAHMGILIKEVLKFKQTNFCRKGRSCFGNISGRVLGNFSDD